MKLHEYQAKERFREAGLTVPDGRVVTTHRAAAKAYRELGGSLAVVKAQIHAGGRGKGGGVRLVRSAKEAQKILNPLVRALKGTDLEARANELMEQTKAS